MEIAIKKQIVHSLWISMTLALGRVLHHPATLTRIGNKFESSAHLRLLTLHMMIALPTQIGNSSVIHTNSVKGIIWQKGNEKKGLQQFLWRLQDPFLACCSNRDISFSRLKIVDNRYTDHQFTTNKYKMMTIWSTNGVCMKLI